MPVRQHTCARPSPRAMTCSQKRSRFLLRHLGIFVGGFTWRGGDDRRRCTHEAIDVLEGLASLVDKSLVVSEEDGEGGHRFRLLESCATSPWNR